MTIIDAIFSNSIKFDQFEVFHFFVHMKVLYDKPTYVWVCVWICLSLCISMCNRSQTWICICASIDLLLTVYVIISSLCMCVVVCTISTHCVCTVCHVLCAHCMFCLMCTFVQCECMLCVIIVCHQTKISFIILHYKFMVVSYICIKLLHSSD